MFVTRSCVLLAKDIFSSWRSFHSIASGLFFSSRLYKVNALSIRSFFSLPNVCMDPNIFLRIMANKVSGWKANIWAHQNHHKSIDWLFVWIILSYREHTHTPPAQIYAVAIMLFNLIKEFFVHAMRADRWKLQYKFKWYIFSVALNIWSWNKQKQERKFEMKFSEFHNKQWRYVERKCEHNGKSYMKRKYNSVLLALILFEWNAKFQRSEVFQFK